MVHVVGTGTLKVHGCLIEERLLNMLQCIGTYHYRMTSNGLEEATETQTVPGKVQGPPKPLG